MTCIFLLTLLSVSVHCLYVNCQQTYTRADDHEGPSDVAEVLQDFRHDHEPRKRSDGGLREPVPARGLAVLVGAMCWHGGFSRSAVVMGGVVLTQVKPYSDSRAMQMASAIFNNSEVSDGNGHGGPAVVTHALVPVPVPVPTRKSGRAGTFTNTGATAMSNQPQPRPSVSATPAPHAPDRSGTGSYSSPRQSPAAGVDSSAAARAATAAVSRSVDGDTYEGFSRDERGRLRYVDPDGEVTLVLRGQGEYATPTREPVAADTVDAVAGWGEVLYAVFWMVVGVLFWLALT